MKTPTPSPSPATGTAAEVFTFQGVDDFLSRVGQVLGTSAWHVVDQHRIHQFAEATGDRQWIHVDPVRAAQGPFGRCIAHGLLTLSMAGGGLFHEVVKVKARMGVNYGCERVRYPAVLPVDSRVRATALLVDAQPLEANAVQVTVRLTVELEGGGKPVCVADFLARYHF